MRPPSPPRPALLRRRPRLPALPRRHVLRGMVGGALASVGLPLLERMGNGGGTALASGAPIPRRLGIFFWGNGCKLDRWVPRRSLADGTPDWELSPELAPLAKVKRYVSVVSGLNVKTGNERGHHGGTVAILSGAPMVSQPHPRSVYSSTFMLPSIDQVAARVIGTKTPFPSLEVGVSPGVTTSEGTTLRYLSHRGPDNPCPPEYDPRKVFDRLFGAAGLPGTGGAQGRSALERARMVGHSVLDVVAEDIRRLHADVGTHDSQRLDQHLTNIREIEMRMLKDWPRRPGCGRARPPGNPFVRDDGKEPHAEVNDAMARLIAHALACDLTRSFSVMFSGSVGDTTYWQVGQTKSHHTMTHDEPGDQPLVHAATVFIVGQFARLLEIFQATPEGAGNLLDSCAILGTTDLPEGKDHGWNDYPILVAGRAGGALRHPGVHYRSRTGENTSIVPLTLLRAVGLPLETFGRRGGLVSESCTAIEA